MESTVNDVSSDSLPGTFNILGDFYHITTDADFSGYVHVCFDYDDNDLTGLAPGEYLSILHYNTTDFNPAQWEDKTMRPVGKNDLGENEICTEVTSLSPFVLGAGTVDIDGDTFDSSVDCDDNNFDINPGAAEVCGDNVDNNCDGTADESCGGDSGTQALGGGGGGGGGGCSLVSTDQNMSSYSIIANILVLLSLLAIFRIGNKFGWNKSS